MSNERFVRVWNAECVRVDQLADSMALQLLQDQYGENPGTKKFVQLIIKKTERIIVGPSQIEYRGDAVE